MCHCNNTLGRLLGNNTICLVTLLTGGKNIPLRVNGEPYEKDKHTPSAFVFETNADGADTWRPCTHRITAAVIQHHLDGF